MESGRNLPTSYMSLLSHFSNSSAMEMEAADFHEIIVIYGDIYSHCYENLKCHWCRLCNSVRPDETLTLETRFS